MTGSLSFNGNILQTANIITNVINHTDLPDQNIGLLEVANANRSAITNTDFPSRTISIAGVIKGNSQVDLDSRIDSFKAYFNGKNKNLDINFAGVTRRYIATKNGISIERTGALQFAPFKVQFICTEPFGLQTTATTLFTKTANADPTYTATGTVGGTAPYQLPVFTITLTAITGTGDYVQISNNANNQTILILGQGLVAGDLLVIDCDQRRVTRNGIVIDYSGVFFELEPGNVSIAYSDGFDTRTVNILAQYYKRYL